MSNERDFQELRKLIIGPEQEALNEIRTDIEETRENRVSNVADVLSESIRESDKNDKTLSNSLRPVVETCIQQSVKRDAKFFADILFPIMGPAIRKAIADALKEVVDSINRSMEQSFSKQALKWRLQSITTGKSYGEIVLKNTLLFRVDQVFLIQRETGLLMQYASHPDWRRQDGKMDSDAVSAMLTAIQDFMHDSFNVEKNDQLDSIDIGGSTVMLSHGPTATLACKVQGIASAELKVKMQEVLESIHLNYSKDLANFNGDRSTLEFVSEDLESLLLQQKKEPNVEKKRSFFLSPFFLLTLLLLLLVIAFCYWQHRKNTVISQYITSLDNTPGIVVSDHGQKGGKLWVKGLKDPLSDFVAARAQKPESLKKPIDYHFRSYQSLEPEIIQARAINLLKIPNYLKTQYRNNELSIAGKLQGELGHQWLQRLQSAPVHIAGINRINVEGIEKNLTLDDFLLQHSELIGRIEKTVFYFANKDSLQFGENEKLDLLQEDISQLKSLLSDMPWTYNILITGYSDSSGSATANQRVRLLRASYIKSQLALAGNFIVQAQAYDETISGKVSVDHESRKATVKVIVK